MVTKIASLFRKSRRPGDGETLAFLTTALQRVIAGDYREMLLAQAREVERRLSEVDLILTACDPCSAMNELAEKIEAVHVSLGDLLSNLRHPAVRVDSKSPSSRTG